MQKTKHSQSPQTSIHYVIEPYKDITFGVHCQEDRQRICLTYNTHNVILITVKRPFKHGPERPEKEQNEYNNYK